ncbi:MAG: hypothetical protein IPH44_28885 [Myxococcales bacterium]|nr:hypothetical protein [Myxococcales bacterium]MBK7191375.1 hypothetical protein [Myxococcales bacterium]
MVAATMTTRAGAAESGDGEVEWRDRVELLVTESNGASSRVLCIPLEGDDTAVDAAPPAPERQELPGRGP